MEARDLSAFNKKALWVARSFRGLTVSQLAADAGFSRQIVSGIENGSAPPSLDVLSTIADTLRFPLLFFFKSPLVPERDVFHLRGRASVPEYAIHSAMARRSRRSSLRPGMINVVSSTQIPRSCIATIVSRTGAHSAPQTWR